MAVIYDFREYHTPRLLSPASQQAREIARQFYDLNEKLTHINTRIDCIVKTQRAFASRLDAYLLKLERTVEFARRCSAACELKSFEQMLKKRDQIIRDSLK